MMLQFSMKQDPFCSACMRRKQFLEATTAGEADTLENILPMQDH